MKRSLKFLSWMAAAAGLTMVCFLPVLHGGFLNWDDPVLFLENPYFRGLSLVHWQWMCTTFLLGHWQPLSWLSYALDFKIWTMSHPQGWHVTNLLLHITNTALVYLLCLAFGGTRSVASSCSRGRDGTRPSGEYLLAALAALFWAVHPLRVEAVAWLATRGYLLCTTFCLLTVLFYLRAVKGGADIPVCSLEKRADRNVCPTMYLTALLCFTLATCTKGIGMMLPFVLLLMDWQRTKATCRTGILPVWTGWKPVLRSIPFFVLSLLTGITAFLAKQAHGGMASVEQYGLADRFGQALYGIWFYLLKTVSPANLSPLYYKRPEAGPVMIALVLTGTVVIFLFLFRRKCRPIIGTFGAFFLLIFPMLGITQSGAQLFADRFTYLAAVPFSLLLAAGLVRLKILRRTVLVALTLLLLIFGARTFVWAGIWTDSLTFWHCAIEQDAKNARAYNGMGQALSKIKAYSKAIEYFDQALVLQPGFLAARQNRALALAGNGQLKEAWDDIGSLLTRNGIAPTDRAKMLLNHGRFAERLGCENDAVQDYSEMIDDQRIDVFWRIQALQLRARLYLEQGRLARGTADLEAILQLPDPTGEHWRKAKRVLDEIKKIPGE